jgi:hypothetical protein
MAKQINDFIAKDNWEQTVKNCQEFAKTELNIKKVEAKWMEIYNKYKQ